MAAGADFAGDRAGFKFTSRTFADKAYDRPAD